MTNFAARSREPEQMDNRIQDAALTRATLDELETVNKRLNGYGPSIQGIQTLLSPSCKNFTLLDVGTGGGDVIRKIADWAEKNNLDVRIRGIDVIPEIVEYAKEKCRPYGNIEVALQDFFDMNMDTQYDVVHTSLVLHHFNEDNLAASIQRMMTLCRRGIIINDLHRHPLAYHSIKLLTRLFARSPMIRHDAPISVLRAFTRADFENLMEKAGFSRCVIRWFWPFRWQVIIWNEKTI